jgi:hypothetical protein
MKQFTKIQKGNIVHLKNGSRGKVVSSYYNKPLEKYIMVEIIGMDYSKTNFHAELIPIDSIIKITS